MRRQYMINWKEGEWKPIPGHTEVNYEIYWASIRGEICRLYYNWSHQNSSNGQWIPQLVGQHIFRPSRYGYGYLNTKIGSGSSRKGY